MATGGWGASLASAWSRPQHAEDDETQIKAVPLTQMTTVDLTGPSITNATATAVPAAPASKHTFSTAYNNFSMPWQQAGQQHNTLQQAGAAAAQPNLSVAAREAALAQREAALEAKEKDLEAREADLRRNGMGPRKNWPACFPIIHHDIANDIPANMQGTVRLAYWCYLGLCLCLLYNFVGACAMVGMNAPDKMSSWFLATIYMLSGVPLGLMLWYMKLYNTVASNGSVGMLGFFIFFLIHVAFCTWAAIAPPLAGERWSFTGFVAALRAFDVGKAAGVIYIIGSCLWTLEALSSW